MMDTIYFFIYLCMENICFFIISKSFIKASISFKKLGISLLVNLFGYALMYLFSLTIPFTLISSLLFIPIQLLMLSICFNMQLKDYIMVYAPSYLLIIGLMQTVTELSLSTLSATDTNTLNILVHIAMLIITLIIYITAPLNKLYEFINKQNFLTKILIVNSSVIATIIAKYIKSSDNIYYVNIFYILTAFLIIIIINILLVSSRNKIDTQQKEINAYNAYMPIIEQLILEVRERQHNHDNHIQSIRMLPTVYHGYDEMCKALSDYTDHMITENRTSSLLKLNLKLVAGFLFSKCNFAQSCNKSLDVHIENFHLSTCVPEYVLIDLIGILTDNAIEATPEESTAHIYLNSIDNKIIIKTSNLGITVTPKFIDNISQVGYSTKHSTDGKPHGLGLPNLINTIKKYNGTLTIENEIINQTKHICFILEI